MSAYNEGDAGSIPGLGGTLEKTMATHSSTLAWKIPWMEKSGGLQFMGLQRVGHDWVTSLSLWHCYEDEVHPIRYATQANKRGIYKGL